MDVSCRAFSCWLGLLQAGIKAKSPTPKSTAKKFCGFIFLFFSVKTHQKRISVSAGFDAAKLPVPALKLPLAILKIG
jgi:hypothetical protein